MTKCKQCNKIKLGFLHTFFVSQTLCDKCLREKEIESLPKCKFCKKSYLEELVGPNNWAHRRGFCCEYCITDYLLDKVENEKN